MHHADAQHVFVHVVPFVTVSLPNVPPPPSPVLPDQVLEYIPMTNYPLFINLLTTFVYIPVRCVCVC